MRSRGAKNFSSTWAANTATSSSSSNANSGTPLSGATNLGLPDPTNFRSEYSSASWDIRHSFTTAFNYDIPFGGRTFKLTTRADRIEQLADGRYAILDYKTGSPPTEKQVRTGLSPQLTLEGAMLRAGAFKDLPPGSLGQFAYVALRGREPAGEESPIEFKDGETADFHADKALAKLKGIVARFEDEATPYRSLVSPMWKTRYGDYDHLARVKEWSAGAEDEDSVE